MVNKKVTTISTIVLAIIFSIGMLENQVHCRGMPTDIESLMVLFPTVQNAKTGYTEDSRFLDFELRKIQDHALRFMMKNKFEDITCAYYFSVVQHMKLSHHFFSMPMGEDEFGYILKFQPIMSFMIGSVSENGDMTVPGLWMFKRYLDELQIYKSLALESMPYNDVLRKIGEVHAGLIGKLTKISGDCKRPNAFEILPEYDVTENRSMIMENFEHINRLIIENQNCNVTVDNPGIYSLDQLYFKDLARNTDIIGQVQHMFDVGVNWRNFNSQLKDDLEQAHDFTKMAHLDSDPVHKYHTSIFDFVYLIVLRMTRRSLPSTVTFFSRVLNNSKNHVKVQPIAEALLKFVELLEQRHGEFLTKILSELNTVQDSYDHVAARIKRAEERIKRRYNLTFTEVHITRTTRKEMWRRIENATRNLQMGNIGSVPDINARIMLGFYNYIRRVLFEGIDFFVIDSIYNTTKYRESDVIVV